ncbi:MAG TPA: helix-turn-helix domain-containing protein [Chthonomonadaceae bacterium]|nr:helix-turn-helix domain-containing protein [Chthonomonadaceae bacterium]
MSILSSVHSEPTTPSDQEAQVARKSSQALASLMKADQEVRFRVCAEGNQEADIALPRSAARLLLGVLEEMGKGKSVALIPTDAELTTQQAADLVRVSRPFFIKLLEEGKIPYRMVGAHRRVLYRDIMRYIQEEEARRVRVMEELVAETERLGLYE